MLGAAPKLEPPNKLPLAGAPNAEGAGDGVPNKLLVVPNPAAGVGAAGVEPNKPVPNPVAGAGAVPGVLPKPNAVVGAGAAGVPKSPPVAGAGA